VLVWVLPWLLRSIDAARASGSVSIPLACFLFLGLVVLLAGPLAWFGAYAMRSGRTVVAAGRYPPPGVRVLRRTRVLTGDAAALVGRGQIVSGALLVGCAVALVAVAAWGVWLLAGGRLRDREVGAPSEPIASRAVVFMEATGAQIEAAGAGADAGEFAVIADDLMFYRAAAHERLAEVGAPVVRVSGRRPLAFVVGGAARSYDFAELPTLDLIVVYAPGSEPIAFAPIDVEEALLLLASDASP
jgi:hypothetical protein